MTNSGGIVICRPAPIAVESGQTVGFTLISDPHLGAPNVNEKKIEEELMTAAAKGDRIALNGDIFDAIFTRDKRYTPNVIHPRFRGRNDLANAVLEFAVEFFSPYVGQIDMIGVGNHDVTLEKFSNLDLVALLVHELQKLASKSHTIHYGGYNGFLDYRFRFKGEKENKDSRLCKGQRLVIYYHHGSGGAAPVTKGMIDFARRGYADCDVLWHGHKHTRLNASVEKLKCPLFGNHPIIREVRHIQTGAYFLTYRGQSQESLRKHGRRSNYAADAGMDPQGQGGARLLVTFPTSKDPYVMRVVQ
jgi:hypothetical protein